MIFKLGNKRIKIVNELNGILFTWLIILTYMMLSETTVFAFLSNYNGIAIFISMILCTGFELINKYKYTKYEILYLIFVLMLVFQNVIWGKFSIAASIFFYLFILRKNDKKIFVRATIWVMITLVLAIVVLCKAQIIPDSIVNETYARVARFSLGFLYPSRVQTYLMVIIMLWINADFKKKAYVYGLIFLNAFSIYCYTFTDAKYPFFLGILISIVSIYSTYKRSKSKYGIRKIIYIFVIAAPIFPFIISALYSKNIGWMNILDNFLTGRLFYSNIGIYHRTLYLLNYLPGLDQANLNHYIYGYFDSGYLNIMYNYGLLLFLLIVAFMFSSTRKAFKTKDIQMVITIVFTILYSMWYGQVITLIQYSTPLLLCTFYLPWRRKVYRNVPGTLIINN